MPGGPGVRLDSHVYAGYRIPPNYDSMIGKLIVHRPTRAAAIAAMKRALGEFHIAPIKTTIPLQMQIMDNPNFRSRGCGYGVCGAGAAGEMNQIQPRSRRDAEEDAEKTSKLEVLVFDLSAFIREIRG